MNKNKKRSTNYQEIKEKDEASIVSKENGLQRYTNILMQKDKIILKIKSLRLSIKLKTFALLCSMSSHTPEEAAIFTFYKNQPMRTDGVLQIPQYSTSFKPKGLYIPTKEEKIICIPRKINPEILSEVTKDNAVGNIITQATKAWFCIYPIFIIYAIVNLLHLILYFIFTFQISILPCESVCLAQICLMLFNGVYGVIKFRRNDVGDFALIDMTIIISIFLAGLGVLIPHFETIAGSTMFYYLKDYKVLGYVYYGMLVFFYIVAMVINGKMVKFYTEYHYKERERTVLMRDI